MPCDQAGREKTKEAGATQLTVCVAPALRQSEGALWVTLTEVVPFVFGFWDLKLPVLIIHRLRNI